MVVSLCHLSTAQGALLEHLLCHCRTDALVHRTRTIPCHEKQETWRKQPKLLGAKQELMVRGAASEEHMVREWRQVWFQHAVPPGGAEL